MSCVGGSRSRFLSLPEVGELAAGGRRRRGRRRGARARADGRDELQRGRPAPRFACAPERRCASGSGRLVARAMDECAGARRPPALAGYPLARSASVVRASARGCVDRARRSLEANSRVPSSARSNTPARSALARRHCNPASDGARAQTLEAEAGHALGLLPRAAARAGRCVAVRSAQRMARAADRRTAHELAASDGDACDGVCRTLHRQGHRARWAPTPETTPRCRPGRRFAPPARRRALLRSLSRAVPSRVVVQRAAA